MTSIHASLGALGPIHRDALTVLALSSQQTIARSPWQENASSAGILGENGRSLSGAPFKRIVEELETSGAVRAESPGVYRIDPEWMPLVLEDAAHRRRLEPIATGLARPQRHYPYTHGPSLGPAGDMRRALAGSDDKAVTLAHAACAYAGRWQEDQSVFAALGSAPPRRWLERLGTHRDEYLRHALHLGFTMAMRLGRDVLAVGIASDNPEIRARAGTVLALEGRAEEGEAALRSGESTTSWERGALAFAALTRGSWPEARDLFAKAAVGARGQRVEPPSYLALFSLLVAISDDDPTHLGDFHRWVGKAGRLFGEWPLAKSALEALVAFRTTGRAHPVDGWARGTWIDETVAALVARWLDLPRDPKVLLRWRARAQTEGFTWLADLLEDVTSNGQRPGSLVTLYKSRPAWEMALDALVKTALAEAESPSGTPVVKEGAVFWNVSLSSWGSARVVPYLVSPRARAGKGLSLRRLLTDSSLPLDTHDRRIASTLASVDAYSDLPLTVLETLAGHPRLRDEQGAPIEVVLRETRIVAEPATGGARIRLLPSHFDESGVAVEREGQRLVVTRRTALVARLAGVIGEGLFVPKSGRERMGEVLGRLSASFPVDAAEGLTTRQAEADARVRVQLFRVGAGLRARLRVVPGGTGVALRPGQAPAEIVVPGAGGLCRVRRDLALEKRGLDALLERCPILASLPRDGEDHVATELDACLELLLELGAADCVVEWPEGQALRAPIVRDARDVRVRLAGTSWLEIQGHVQIDPERVIAMKDLIASASRGQGRFVPIGPNEYLALTEDVRAKLEALGRVQELGTKGRVPLALMPAVEGWVEGLDVTWSAELTRRRDALEVAERLTPKVPRGLEAELRDYQRDGFTFLARRASSGLGACLADDMGLGKTVQALALLLHRAKEGPALIVAPTSVCRNWEEEAARFAPTLRLHRLAGGAREQVIGAAGKGDVVVTSYGLLVAEGERLSGKRWSTVVFDEAHALKNATTRRWAAARAVCADAIVALTGTPVENHIAELHALFDVIIPGMLGPRAAFERVFAAPLAAGSRDAVNALRQIVRPLVLRRTKAQVLTELPEKTELTRVISPTAEHRAFYEAVRLRAIERLAAANGAPGGQARIQILAEITRLRRAAIDPRLVGGETAPEGAKLDALVHLVTELRAEGHRALVFSQFLEVLDLARERLEAISVTCRRLDGTMSADARAAEVNAFQAGQGDVFLLSLKAGGVGMNLTGADFVIHLDPWWNPAVEDQATDRAHRIGQTRPVTIVRLVTEGTIEEKVLAMHGAKRKLYEDVVGAADGTGRLDVNALADLLGADTHTPAPRRGRAAQERAPS